GCGRSSTTATPSPTPSRRWAATAPGCTARRWRRGGGAPRGRAGGRGGAGAAGPGGRGGGWGGLGWRAGGPPGGGGGGGRGGAEELLAAMRLDKKAQAGRLRFVLPRRLGEVELVEVAEDEVRAVLGG